MKSSVVLASLCASLVVATPLEKRFLVTDYEIETVTMTVTGGWGGWGGWHHNTPAAAVTTITQAPAPPPVMTQAPAPAPAAPTEASSSPADTWAAPSAAPAPASSASSPSDYAGAILFQHNIHRANSSAPDLTWSDSMASIAQEIAASCVYAHNTGAGGGGYGQNIGAGADGSGVPAMITNEMYNGEINYYPGYGSEPDMSDFEHWGHYSQIVWKDTTSVGCYTQYCPGGLANVGSGVSPYFTVCNYSPPGNFGGQYAANVGQPLGQASVSV